MTFQNLAKAEAEIARLREVILAIDAATKDDPLAQTRIERNLKSLRAVEKIDTAFAAIGGETFNKKECQCDHEINWHCEYCAVHEALLAAKNVLSLARTERARPGRFPELLNEENP